MNSEQRIKALENEIITLNEKVKNMDFKQGLLYDQTPINKILFEYDILKEQYVKLMDLMDAYRKKIEKNEEVDHGSFEECVYEIVPNHEGNYHFVEFLSRAFKEEGRWEEVFDELYGGTMPKYKNM